MPGSVLEPGAMLWMGTTWRENIRRDVVGRLDK